MADDFTELKDFAKVFSTQPLPKGNRIAVITLAGSVGVVVSDLSTSFGLVLPSEPAWRVLHRRLQESGVSMEELRPDAQGTSVLIRDPDGNGVELLVAENIT